MSNAASFVLSALMLSADALLQSLLLSYAASKVDYIYVRVRRDSGVLKLTGKKCSINFPTCCFKKISYKKRTSLQK